MTNSDLPLLQFEDLQYVGAFKVPLRDFPEYGLEYGGTAVGYNPINNSLFMTGHDHVQRTCEIEIPTLVNSNNLSDLNRAAQLQDFRALEGGAPNGIVDENAVKIGGHLVSGNDLVFTAFGYYDGDGDIVLSHGKVPANNLQGIISGLYVLDNAAGGGGFVGGYMCNIPDHWQADFGAPCMTGQASLAVVGRTSLGPAVFGFDPADVGVVNPVPTVPYLYYPITNPLREYSSTNPVWNGTSTIEGIAFPKNTRTVLFFGSHGTGSYCYGTPEECNDDVRGGKGVHSYGGTYVSQIWAYDALDLLDVKNGVKNAWDIEPYAVWQLTLPFQTGSGLINATIDVNSNRLYISQLRAEQYGYSPLPVVHAMDVVVSNSGGGEDPPVEDTEAPIVSITNPVANADVSGVVNITADYSDNVGVTNVAYLVDGVETGSAWDTSLESAGAHTVTVMAGDANFNSGSDSVTVNVVLPPPPSEVYVSSVSELVSAVNSLSDGQTIIIASGTYQLTDALYIPQGVQNVTLRGETGNRDDVVLVGDATVNFGIWISASPGAIIKDLTIDSVAQHTIIVGAGSHGSVFENLHLIDSGDQFLKLNPNGYGVGSDDCVVRNCLLEYRTTDADDYTNGVDVHGGKRTLIEDCEFRNFLSPVGEQVAGPAVLIWNGAADTVVHDCRFVNCARAISFGLVQRAEGVEHSGGLIYNNVVYRSAVAEAVDVPIMVASSPNTKVLHNTVFTGADYPNAVEVRFADSVNVEVKNNLLLGNILNRDGATAITSNNYLAATADMFVDAAAGDLHLTNSSSAIANAINQGPILPEVVDDFDDNDRVDGNADLGAYEYQGVLDTEAPQVSLTAPMNGAIVSGEVNVTATATDNFGVARVDFMIDGTVVGSDSEAPYTYVWNTLQSPNSVELLARAYDAAGNFRDSDPVDVTVHNCPVYSAPSGVLADLNLADSQLASIRSSLANLQAELLNVQSLVSNALSGL